LEDLGKLLDPKDEENASVKEGLKILIPKLGKFCSVRPFRKHDKLFRLLKPTVTLFLSETEMSLIKILKKLYKLILVLIPWLEQYPGFDTSGSLIGENLFG
jgi:hypothetical protein